MKTVWAFATAFAATFAAMVAFDLYKQRRAALPEPVAPGHDSV